MKIIISALALLTILSGSISAQTSSGTEPVLQIKNFRWFENVPSVGCDDCAGLPSVAVDYRISHRAGVGDFVVWIVLKNMATRSIKSVNVDFVFRDTETEREFLTYHLRFDQEIGGGKTKEMRHKIVSGKEPDSFQPAAPGYELVSRTRGCGDSPWLGYKKSGRLIRIRDNPKLLKIYPCYYTPTVTRIDYTDGSVWRP